MKLLEDKILSSGTVLPGNILKVDSFLNHQLDVKLLNELGKEFYRLFSDYKITKILTVEASGIAIACFAAQYFDVPVVFAKKGHHKNIGTDVYTAEVFSFTKGTSYTVFVSRKYLSSDDTVLIIDDFLANGQAALGLKSIVENAGAKLAGVGIAIEKGFQDGGKNLREAGVNLKSLAIVDSMTDDSISFRNDG
ncbi:MAG: xanthine phosphoribosyltransferase [Clostridia bacterium]|nr:xanthine phosphoribosyltransferase [Clostridia bacterium]